MLKTDWNRVVVSIYWLLIRWRQIVQASFESENRGGKTRTENRTHWTSTDTFRVVKKSKNLFQIAH